MSALSLLLFACFLLQKIDPNAGMEPGKEGEDLESVEEVSPHEESSTVDADADADDVQWIPTAVLDVAYYLRKHKNNGYDPRYLLEGSLPVKDLYRRFPDPPLRNIHWEVRKNCETSFSECLRYLQDTVSQTELPRHLDSATIARENGWTMDRDADLIREVDDACVELRERDEKTFNLFQGPLEKFQWLVSAGYYMCWYTMNGVHHLRSFLASCDDFANCIDWDEGLSNGDVRADDSVPFACAQYSFCPDPCCPLKLVRSLDDCRRVNPCVRHRPIDETCRFRKSLNADFESVTNNWWNVTCDCDRKGMRWESRSGICVDVDECTENSTACKRPSQSCMNLPGSYRCVCNMMGYHDVGGNCEVDPVVHRAIHPPKTAPHRGNKTIAHSFFDFVYRLKSVVGGAREKAESDATDNSTDVPTV